MKKIIFLLILSITTFLEARNSSPCEVVLCPQEGKCIDYAVSDSGKKIYLGIDYESIMGTKGNPDMEEWQISKKNYDNYGGTGVTRSACINYAIRAALHFIGTKQAFEANNIAKIQGKKDELREIIKVHWFANNVISTWDYNRKGEATGNINTTELVDCGSIQRKSGYKGVLKSGKDLEGMFENGNECRNGFLSSNFDFYPF